MQARDGVAARGIIRGVSEAPARAVPIPERRVPDMDAASRGVCEAGDGP